MVSYKIQGSPPGCGISRLEIPGVSQVQNEEHRCSDVSEPTWGSLLVVPFVVDGISVYCTGAFEIRGSVGCNRPDRVQDGTQTRTDTHTHKTPFVAATKGIPWNAAAVAPWLLQRTELGGRGDTCTSAATDRTAKIKKLKLNRTLCS